jgi:hypothetical protein
MRRAGDRARLNGADQMRGQSWTLESIALLRKLWGEGETAVTIADRLGGMSRSAVLGKIFRLRLHIDDAAAAARGLAAAALTHQAEKAAAPARRRRSGVGKKHAQAAPTKAVQRKTLLELTNRTCRWILEAAVKWALTRALSHFP